ncbi:MAG: LysR family transcriptional regulator [Lawsonibacter sp.]
MDNRDWELLLALAEEKTMAKAGSRVFLSQPAVVYRLNQMEKEFGVKLFLRNNRGIQFTGAGQKLYAHASDMIRQSNQIHQEIQLYGTGLTGTITLGSSGTFLNAFLPAQLKAFNQQFPLVSVTLISKRNDALVEMLNSGQLSVAVVRLTPPWNGPCFHIYDDPLVLIAAHPCSLSDLAGMPYIPYGGDKELVGTIEDWGLRTFHRPFVTFADTSQVTGPQICIQLVKAGLGWSVVPLSRTLAADGLYRRSIQDESGHIMTRSTNLLYTKEICQTEIYHAYITHFQTYFSNFPFPSPETVPPLSLSSL